MQPKTFRIRFGKSQVPDCNSQVIKLTRVRNKCYIVRQKCFAFAKSSNGRMHQKQKFWLDTISTGAHNNSRRTQQTQHRWSAEARWAIRLIRDRWRELNLLVLCANEITLKYLIEAKHIPFNHRPIIYLPIFHFIILSNTSYYILKSLVIQINYSLWFLQ